MAQNIQENSPSAAQTGASIFAGGEHTAVATTGEYAVRFAVATSSTQVRVGFEAVGASGNWIAVDNFRLTQEAAGVDAAKGELLTTLAALIADANAQLAAATNGRGAYAQAIADAQAVADNGSASPSQLASATESLRSAPRVATDARWTAGSDVAYGRLTVSGVASSQLLEQGFCWSATNTEPTVLDERSALSLDYNGTVSIMPELTPSTAYYVRAYAMTKGHAVGYGDIVKVVTIPRGTVTWWYNNGADADANARINAALEGAVGYWNRLTSITGFGVSCSYGSGTPTADCSYGGSMRIGPSASYQRIGTVMHEMLHGIGVGTHSMWWNGEMRSNGDRGD